MCAGLCMHMFHISWVSTYKHDFWIRLLLFIYIYCDYCVRFPAFWTSYGFAFWFFVLFCFWSSFKLRGSHPPCPHYFKSYTLIFFYCYLEWNISYMCIFANLLNLLFKGLRTCELQLSLQQVPYFVLFFRSILLLISQIRHYLYCCKSMFIQIYPYFFGHDPFLNFRPFNRWWSFCTTHLNWESTDDKTTHSVGNVY